MSNKDIHSDIDSVLLDVEGMKCGGWVNTVEQTLQSQKNVINANVNLVERTAFIDLKDKENSLENVLNALANRGFPAKERILNDQNRTSASQKQFTKDKYQGDS